MQNEAIHSLITIYVALESDNQKIQKLFKRLSEAEIGKHLVFIINKYGEKMDEKTVQNMVVLLEQLVKRKELLKHLEEAGLNAELDKLEKKAESVESLKKLARVRSIL